MPSPTPASSHPLRAWCLGAAFAITSAAALAPRAAHAEELPIPVQVETLPNGLRVVLSPEHTAPTVAIAVYYDVGARVEERGHSGFAHLFEHMMFEGSANVGKGEHFRLIAQHGGDFNGTTSEDRTNYFETLPANALELGLWLEADRMRSLNINQANFENQRQTVMEERRQSYENRPYMLSILRRDELAYGEYFPYAHSVIGDMADLQRASLADVRAFHDRYYTPNNAVLSIAGDFEPAQALELVRRHFGGIPRRETPRWQDPGFPGQTAERVESMTDPLAELPAFHLVYHIPPRRTPDHYALEMLAVVLGDGESSRLYQSLVKTREVANSIEVTTEDRRGPDLFTFWCVLAQGHTPGEARPLIYQALDDIARNGITGRELEKAKNRVRSAFVFGLQSNLQRAQQLAEFEMYDGNAALLRTELDRYLAVTLEDVRRVAGQYFRPTNRTVLDVLPPAERGRAPSGPAGSPNQPAPGAPPPSTPSTPRPGAPTPPTPPNAPAPTAPGAPGAPVTTPRRPPTNGGAR
jgi:predicted Zn-dependent peptidase